jgi:hypothetical protein
MFIPLTLFSNIEGRFMTAIAQGFRESEVCGKRVHNSAMLVGTFRPNDKGLT